MKERKILKRQLELLYLNALDNSIDDFPRYSEAMVNVYNSLKPERRSALLMLPISIVAIALSIVSIFMCRK